VNVRELCSLLDALDPESVVTVIDPYLHAECHVAVEGSEFAVLVESTGRILSEEDIS
jgi:hypothetical protein